MDDCACFFISSNVLNSHFFKGGISMTNENQIWQDLLALFSEEELIRFVVRARRAGKKQLMQLLEVEINKRGK
jgi:hypothetical protein